MNYSVLRPEKAFNFKLPLIHFSCGHKLALKQFPEMQNKSIEALPFSVLLSAAVGQRGHVYLVD